MLKNGQIASLPDATIRCAVIHSHDRVHSLCHLFDVDFHVPFGFSLRRYFDSDL
jgi:hypothetical protein